MEMRGKLDLYGRKFKYYNLVNAMQNYRIRQKNLINQVNF